MCGSRSGITFFCCFSSLLLLCLAPDAFAISQNGVSSNGRTFTAQPDKNGSWRVRDAEPSDDKYTSPSAGSPKPSSGSSWGPRLNPQPTYAPDQMPNPVGNSSGISDLWETPNLPVPYSADAIPGIVESDLVKYAPLASVAAPFIVRLVGLTPEGRAAVLGGAAVMDVYSQLYPSQSSDASKGVPTNTYSCDGVSETSTLPIIPAGTYVCWEGSGGPVSSPVYLTGHNLSSWGGCPIGSDTADGGPSCSDGSVPVPTYSSSSGSGSPSGSSSIPAPSVASLTKELEANNALAAKLLQALPQSLSETIPMQQTASGPKSVTGQSTKVSSAYNALPSNLTQPSTASDAVPVTKTVTSTPTYSPSYNPSNGSVTVAKSVTNVTKVCTASGSCTTTDSTTSPASIKSPFVPPSVLYPSPSTAVPTSSTPFTTFSFGSPWLPKVCPSAPTYQVCVVGGSYCKTEKLPTNIICKLASGIEPIVTTGGGLLGLLILAW